MTESSTPADDTDADADGTTDADTFGEFINEQNECFWKPLLAFSVAKQRDGANFLSARANMGTNCDGRVSIAVYC